MKRKLELGSVLRESFAIYRERAGALLPVAFWLFLAVGIVEELASSYVVAAVFAGLLGMVATVVYQGMVAGLVRDVEEGRGDTSAGEMFRSVGPVLLPLVVASLLAVLGIVLGTIFFVVPGLIAATFWAVLAPAVVVERAGVLGAFERSQNLVSGNGGRVFAAFILGLLIVLAFGIVLVLLAESLEDGPFLRIVVSALAGAIAAPVSGLIAAILYFRLRDIEEAESAVVEQPGDGLG